MDRFQHPCPDTKMYLARETTFKNLQSLYPRVNQCYAEARSIARAGKGVLIEGESGTGKDQVAIAMYNESLLEGKHLVQIGCGGIPASLLESEAFGCMKGAWTDGREARPGFIRRANGGILLMDEFDMIPIDRQAAFLRAFQLGMVLPVGATEEVPVQILLYATSNRILKELVNRGLFRLDLYMRISPYRIWVPPLRERPDDIVPCFYDRYHKECMALNREEEPLTADLVAPLKVYEWPGNLRELSDLAKAAAVIGLKRAIEMACLSRRGNGEPSGDGQQEGIMSEHWKAERIRYVYRKWLEYDKDYEETGRRVGLSRAMMYACVAEMKRLLGLTSGRE